MTEKRQTVEFRQNGKLINLPLGEKIVLEQLPRLRNVALAFKKRLCLRVSLESGESIRLRIMKLRFTAGNAYFSGEIENDDNETARIDFQAAFYYFENKGWIEL